MYQLQLTQSLVTAQPETPYRPMTIAALLHQQVAARGPEPALREVLTDGAIGREWCFADLLADSERLGRALAGRHERGERIAIFADNIPEWVLMELAAPLAALTLVTVNPALGADELRYVLEQSRASAIYFARSVRGNPLEPVVEAACNLVPTIAHRIALTDHAALFEGESSGLLRDTVPTDVVQIQYTSGTTGRPKGAMLHQAGLIQNGFDSWHRLGANPGETMLTTLPLFHTAGCALSVLGGLAHGMTLLLARAHDTALLTRLIERERPALLVVVPTVLVNLIEEAERTGRDLASFKAIMVGGAMVSPELIARARRAFHAPVQIIYGQTEASPGITLAWSGDADEGMSGTIGQPLPHMDVAILDTASGAVCPVGSQGEICCRGYNVMSGYNDNPQATAAAIDADGWLHTGDLGTMNERGYVSLTGRVKDMIIRGGENLFPVEIENAMLEHDAILEVAVVGIPDEKWGEIVACFMRPAGDARPRTDELKRFIRDRLSPQKTPAHWIWVDGWPMTGSGKIQKFALRDAYLKGEFASSLVAPLPVQPTSA